MTQLSSPQAIRLSITPEVDRALKRAKQLYPTLSAPEILKLGLSKIVTSRTPSQEQTERTEIRQAAAYAVGDDYLNDPAEDIYIADSGKKVHFS
jgi:hypothetical protein